MYELYRSALEMKTSVKMSWLLLLLTLVTGFDTITGQLVIQGIRLRGGNTTAGRVEVQINGVWGTVCDDAWDDLDAAVVCRFLGLNNGGRATTNARFGQGVGTIYLDDVSCRGDETNLDQCKMNPSIGNVQCTHAEDAGVECFDTGQPLVTTTTQRPIGPQPNNCTQLVREVRLIAPQGNAGVGVVEVFNNGVWGTVCDDEWDELGARVVCRMLCYNTVYSRPGAPEEVIKNVVGRDIVLDQVRCTGNENRIQDCPSVPGNQDCGPTEKASVTCVDLDSKAPDPPVPILLCENGILQAFFDRSKDVYLEEKHLTVDNTFPNCTLTKNTNSTYVSISIPFNGCNTDVTYNTTHIIYFNTIQYGVTHYDGNRVRVNSYPITVFCEMPRDLAASRALEPLTIPVTKKAEGEFFINMTFYQNNSFTNAVTQYPLRMPLGEWLNVALQLTSVDSNLKLVVPDCVATPSEDPNDPIRYPLFENNCPNEPTIGLYPLSQIKFGYRYQPFMFVNRTSVFIHCGAFVCLLEETNAECDRSCNTTKPAATIGRRKRETTRPKYYIQSDLLVVYKPNNVETSIERIGGLPLTSSTTISIPLSTEIQEKLAKSTQAKQPTTSPSTTRHTYTRHTYGTKVTMTTRNALGEKVTTSSTVIRNKEDDTTTASSQTVTTTVTALPPSVAPPTTSRIKTPLEGVWIEYPRRETTQTTQTTTRSKLQYVKTVDEENSRRLRFGVNSATGATSKVVVLFSCVGIYFSFVKLLRSSN